VAGLDIRNANNGVPSQPLPNPVLGAAATAYEPRTRAASAPGRGSRRYGGGAEESAPVPVGVTRHRTQRPRGQVGPPGPHTPSPSQLPPGPRGRTVANISPLDPQIAQLVQHTHSSRHPAASAERRGSAAAAGSRQSAAAAVASSSEQRAVTRPLVSGQCPTPPATSSQQRCQMPDATIPAIPAPPPAAQQPCKLCQLPAMPAASSQQQAAATAAAATPRHIPRA
jgi:hypothetical protein